MIQSLIGKKTYQTRIFTDDGKQIPVTEIVAGPCYVTSIISQDTHKSIQIGFGNSKQMAKAQVGHLKKAGLDKKLRFFREVRVDEIPNDITVGQELTVGSVFAVGDKIRVTGISKGKGFAGVVKRHHFKGGPRTHGQSDRERSPGSIGQTTTPGRVYKGKRMAGHMGVERVTIRGLKVMNINQDTQTIQVKGVIPGHINGLVMIEKEA
jgi:large subunit ribosomal protein L3